MKAQEQKGLGGITQRVVIIFRGACDLEFVVFVFLCRADAGGSVRRGAVTRVLSGLLKCIKLNDWQWLKPHRARGKLPWQRLSSADLFCLLFTISVKSIFVCLTDGAHGSRLGHYRKELLHPVRRLAPNDFWKAWANTVVSSNTLSRGSQSQ